MADPQPPTDHTDLAQEQPQQPQTATTQLASRFPRRTFLGGTATLALTALSPESASADPPRAPAPQRPQPPSPPAMPRLTAQLGHSFDVRSVCFSADGRFVLTGSLDKTARLWDAATGKLIRTFEGHGAFIWSVSLSPDSRFVLTGGDYATRLWDAATGKLLRTFEGHAGSVNSVCFSPDGRFVLIGGEDTTCLWDVASGKALRTFRENSGSTLSVCFSPNGRFVLTGSNDKMARLWDTATGKLLRTFEGHAGLVRSVCFSPDGRFIVTGSEDETARLWGVSTGKLIRKFQGDSGSVNSVCFSPDGHYVLIGEDSGPPRLWDAATGKEFRTFKEVTSGPISSVCFSPNGRYILTGSWLTVSRDKAVCLWDIATGKVIRTFEGFSDWVNSVCCSPDGRFIVTGGDDNTARLWETATGKVLRTFEGHAGSVNSIGFSPDSRFVLTGNRGTLQGRGTVRLWEVSTNNTIRTFEGLTDSVNSVCFSPDGRFVLAGGGDTACLWDSASGELLRSFGGHSDLVYSVCFSPDGRFVLTGSRSTLQSIGAVRLWDTSTGKELHTFEGDPGSITSVCFSPDGRLVLASEIWRMVYLWDSVTGKLLRTFVGRSGSDYSVCFSPDGRFILAGGGDTARLWDVASGKELRTFEGHSAFVSSICFSTDGRFVLTGSRDSTTRLWDATTGQLLCILIAFRNGTWAVVMPDGRFDCLDLDEIRGLHWIFPDDPFRPLPLEIFQRQYYEPGLLKRLWNGEKFPPLPSLAELNRIQPGVAVAGARVAPDGTATVSVDIASVIEKNKQSGALDLRLFRDGQLVGVRAGALQNGRATFTGIRLPKRAGPKSVEFSAYCFNKSLVKSETAKHAIPLPVRSKATATPRRAFIVCVGVDSSQGDGLSLRFAVRDAEATADTVSARLRSAGQYTEVVVTRLLAPAGATGSEEVTATKADLHAVLAKLAGKTPAPEEVARLTRIPGADRLQPATPDDLLLLSFSGHGYAGEGGIFYLLPYDIGPGTGMSPERLTRCISSDDLSLWLQGVDAGDISFIVDACHSATVVEGDGTFKPGPMGSRGLGQLAYDKRILLLAATQAANVALEDGDLGHGLLTYALIKDGLEAEKAVAAVAGGHLTLSAWLDYGVKRVPELWEDIRTGKGRLARGVSPEVEPAVAAGKRKDLQQPMLFDFSKKAGTERDPQL